MKQLAFDIGAHDGASAQVYSPLFERVISCEPCQESYTLLLEVAAQLPNVTTINCGVSDHNGTMDLAVQADPISSGQLTNGHPIWGQVEGYRTLPCRTIDDLAQEFGDPDLISIDTEGHELLIINGGLEAIRRAKPDLFIEIHEESQGDEITRIFAGIYDDPIEKRFNPVYPDEGFFRQNYYFLMTSGVAGSLIDLPF